MHFSMQHNWDGTTPVSTTPQANGNWLGADGPEPAPPEAPGEPALPVLPRRPDASRPTSSGANVNASPDAGPVGRRPQRASALGAPYESSRATRSARRPFLPGFNPMAAGVPATSQYNAANGLECISCHLQHGSAHDLPQPRAAHRCVPAALQVRNDERHDEGRLDQHRAPYTPNTGNAATFNPLYDNANVSYNRTDPASPAGATTHRPPTAWTRSARPATATSTAAPAIANIGATAVGAGPRTSSVTRPQAGHRHRRALRRPVVADPLYVARRRRSRSTRTTAWATPTRRPAA